MPKKSGKLCLATPSRVTAGTVYFMLWAKSILWDHNHTTA